MPFLTAFPSASPRHGDFQTIIPLLSIFAVKSSLDFFFSFSIGYTDQHVMSGFYADHPASESVRAWMAIKTLPGFISNLHLFPFSFFSFYSVFPPSSSFSQLSFHAHITFPLPFIPFLIFPCLPFLYSIWTFSISILPSFTHISSYHSSSSPPLLRFSSLPFFLPTPSLSFFFPLHSYYTSLRSFLPLRLSPLLPISSLHSLPFYSFTPPPLPSFLFPFHFSLPFPPSLLSHATSTSLPPFTLWIRTLFFGVHELLTYNTNLIHFAVGLHIGH